MIQSYIRTMVFYLALVGSVRLMGKRQIGQMEPSEFVVTMLLANLAAIPMEDGGTPVYLGMVPILTVAALELVLSGISMSSIRIRRVLCGRPVILVENGRILQRNLRKTRITLDELAGHLREKNVLDVGTVQYAILETNGNLSVFRYPEQEPASAAEAGIKVQSRYLPVTLVSDGHLLRENLMLARKSERWVEKTLRKRKTNVADTLLLSVDKADTVIFLPREEKT